VVNMYQLGLVILSQGHWRIKCVKCASGRHVKSTDREVKRAIRLREESKEMKPNEQYDLGNR